MLHVARRRQRVVQKFLELVVHFGSVCCDFSAVSYLFIYFCCNRRRTQTRQSNKSPHSFFFIKLLAQLENHSKQVKHLMATFLDFSGIPSLPQFDDHNSNEKYLVRVFSHKSQESSNKQV